MYEHTIRSPGLTRRTPGPTDSTTPAPSCPPTIGKRTGASPWVMWSSEWHSPDACSRTRTSCAFGSSSCSSASSQPMCGPRAMAARVVILIWLRPFLAGPGHRLELGQYLRADERDVIKIVDVKDVQVDGVGAGPGEAGDAIGQQSRRPDDHRLTDAGRGNNRLPPLGRRLGTPDGPGGANRAAGIGGGGPRPPPRGAPEAQRRPA